jgi:NAD(P)-dependent dehydrogenase (short-subunit alcohol dehydrogenase family)
MNLNDKLCVVTGAARGIGLAISQALIHQGAKVIMADIDAVSLADAAKVSGGIPVVCDITRSNSVAQLTAAALEAGSGKLDVWINNAGLARHRWIQDYTEEEIDLMLAVNLKGTILGSQQALRCMIPQRSGHIINLISTASLRGIPSETVYCAAKWGVRGFTQGLAEEAAAHRIRVTAILPGGVATEFWTDASSREAPLQKFLQPSHIADGVLQVLAMDDFCVTRELVLRSLDDSDFSVQPN